MKAAIYNTIFSAGVSNSTLNIRCPTGNCTFDPIDTLGFCSTCNDVTSQITKVNCTETQVPGRTKRDLSCPYILPSNLTITLNKTAISDDYSSAVSQADDYYKTTNMSMVALNRTEVIYANNITATPSSGIATPPGWRPSKTNFQGIDDPLLAFGQLFLNDTYPGDDAPPLATECALSFCVQSINTSVVDGVFYQRTIKTWLNTSASDTGDVWLQPPAQSLLGSMGRQRNFYVSSMANIPLADFLESTFSANVSGIDLPEAESGLTPDEQSMLTEYTSDTAQAFFTMGVDLEDFMSSLADRMTDSLRQQGIEDSQFSNSGDVYVVEAYIHVRWPWLILPIITVLASSGLLIASIFSSPGRRDIMWKNSSLAVLFHGIGSYEPSHPITFKKEMEATAEKLYVQLKEDMHGELHLLDAQNPAVVMSTIKPTHPDM